MALPLSQSRDTYCLDSLQPGRTARGKTLLGQRCYHRLITPPGTLRGGEEEADFGLDLAAKIGEADELTNEKMLPGLVQNELLKDPTVDSVTVIATRTESGGLVSWELAIHVEGVDGEVDLLVAASEVSVDLLGIS